MNTTAQLSYACLFVALTIFIGCDQSKPELESGAQSAMGTSPDAGSSSSSTTLPVAESDQASGNAVPKDNTNPLLAPRNQTGISAPIYDSDTTESSEPPTNSTKILNRPFVTIMPSTSDEPQELVQHLKKVDEAIGDLVVAGSNNIIEKDVFVESGMRLGRMKLESGQRLANAENATPEERKTGVLAQLVALSHMSGIGDVASAQQLETLAAGLADSEDADLAHQGRLVQLGFSLQALQNGVQSDPNDLLAGIEGLFERPQDRNFPEFMMLQQAIHVLNQMGFADSAARVKAVLIEEYQDATDAQLRNDAWLIATQNSQALANYNTASQSIGTEQFDPQALSAAARGLFDAFPTASTLEQLARSIANIEYGGFVEVSQQVADFVEAQQSELAPSPASVVTNQLLNDHKARLSFLGKPLDLQHVVDFSKSPIDLSRYEGKVVLVDFWATWCLPCLKEIPNIREAYEEFSDDGFEVISINMDDSPEKALQFIEAQKLPWQSFYFSDEPGFQSAFAKQYGLNMIPFIALVGKDGLVKRIHVRGEQLMPTIREELGGETLGSEDSLIPDAL